MILIMILFSITEKSSIIRLCVITYYLTMCYDFIFVLNHAIEFTALTVTRTLLHLGLVLVSGCLVNLVLKRRKSERVYSDKKIEKLELQKIANEVRKDIVTALHSAKAGHPGGSLSAADVFTYLYFEEYFYNYFMHLYVSCYVANN